MSNTSPNPLTFTSGPALAHYLSGSNGNVNVAVQDIGGGGVLLTIDNGDFLEAGVLGGANRVLRLADGTCVVLVDGPNSGASPGDGDTHGCMTVVGLTRFRGTTPPYQICLDCLAAQALRMLGLL